MRAVILRRFGGPEVLELGEVPRPRPRRDEVLVEVRASSINPRDWLIRSGKYPFQGLLPRRPFVPGSDLAGVVAEAGSASAFEPGQAVFAMQPTSRGFGAHGEYVAVPATALAPKPECLSFEEAAGIPLAGLTALQALRDDARLREGQSVLVIGASGGVGTYAVQIARALGARVTGVCSARNRELVEGLGAERVIDYQATNPLEHGERFDVVFDVIGKESLERCDRVLRRDGVYVTTVPRRRQIAAWARSAVGHRLGLTRRRSTVVLVRSRGVDLRWLAGLAEKGALRTVIDRVLPLEEIATAHELSRTFRTRGKLILRISGE
jgi:NADPH:quinone reductase-like Zn-dependent oxidoreductase